ncbi:hypothetical protein D3C73_483320 [compost metagenome]
MQQLYRWLKVLMFIGVILVNWASISIPLFGRTTGDISDMYHVAVTPAGYAFSIWSFIYLLLAGFVIIQALPRGWSRPEIQRIGPWFIIISMFNILWLLFWHSLHIPTTVAIMILMLISLIVAYRRSRPDKKHPDFATRWFIALPFSIYLGWISVATIVNISVGLQAAGWDGWGIAPQTWAIGLVVLAGLLALLMGTKYRDPFYGLVIIWASIAIALEQKDAFPSLAYAAYGIAGILFIYVCYAIIIRKWIITRDQITTS